VTLQKYKEFVKRQRKGGKNLENTGKVRIFAVSNIKFGYPGKFPAREQDHIDTTPNLIKGYLVALYLLYLFVKVLKNILSLRDLGVTTITFVPLNNITSIASGFNSKYFFIQRAKAVAL
jgi:hypothetical protein